MIRRPATLLALLLCLIAAGCGGDDEEPADTATTPTEVPTATAPPVETETEEAETEPAGSSDETISRADAGAEAARQASLEADSVPNSDLFFASPEDVECESPDADQPDNANERAAEWTCTVDAETNGVSCSGTVVVFSSPGANPGKTFEDIDVRDADISCSPS